MKESAGELAFWQQIKSAGLRGWEREYAFCPGRKWRFDFANVSVRLAVEVEGGHWFGRHTRGNGFEKDVEKYNEAIARGWRVLRGTTEQAESGWLLAYVQRCL